MERAIQQPVPRTQHEDDELRDDIQVAAGDLFTEDAKSLEADEACMIFLE